MRARSYRPFCPAAAQVIPGLCPAELTWDQVLSGKMQRHHLVSVGRRSMIRAGRGDLGACTPSCSPRWSSCCGTAEGLSRDGVRNALWKSRSLVKTWPCGDVLLPAEYGRWQGALASYDHYRKPAWFRLRGLLELDRLIEIIGAVPRGPGAHPRGAGQSRERRPARSGRQGARAGAPSRSRRRSKAASASVPTLVATCVFTNPRTWTVPGTPWTARRPRSRPPGSSWP